MPVAQKIEKKLELHGHTRIDPYYWMNDRENPAVTEYLEAENIYLETVMAPTKTLQKKLFKEMKGRMKEDDQSAPFLSNEYYYYTRFVKGSEYPIYCRKMGSLDASEEVVLDVNELANNYVYFNVGEYDVSPDNRMLVFTVDTAGRRQYTILVKNLESGEIIETGLKFAGGDVVWAADSRTFFYTSIDPITLRYDRIYRYTLGLDLPAEEVYYETDETFYYISVSRSKDRRFIMIHTNSTLSNETWLLEANNPTGKFRVFQPRQKNLLYHVYPHIDQFYILTNRNAQNFRLMRAEKNITTQSNWIEVVAHRHDVLLENIEVFNDYLVLQERMRGLRQFLIQNLSDGNQHYLQFHEEAYTASIGINAEMNSKILRFNYTSLTTPSSTYDYNMDTRERQLIKQQEVLGGFNPAQYETRRLFASARDGVEVPITLVYQKGIEKDGNNPLFLTGYGSYGASTDPRFNSNSLSLINRGFIYAIAHVRGGQELGRQWYEDGKLLKKKNTFYDFIDCAEYLIAQNYTRPDKLFAGGGSAGGLLMGAVVNLRPDLFKGVIAAVPFVDVVTTMLDTSIPLTTAEYDEWGNPNQKEYYDYMLSYSPYDNVLPGKYPNLLVTAGLHDSQVQYFEPAKWVAKLRENNSGDGIILLYTNMEAGHGGASGRFKRLKEIAREYAFLISLSDRTKK